MVNLSKEIEKAHVEKMRLDDLNEAQEKKIKELEQVKKLIETEKRETDEKCDSVLTALHKMEEQEKWLSETNATMSKSAAELSVKFETMKSSTHKGSTKLKNELAHLKADVQKQTDDIQNLTEKQNSLADISGRNTWSLQRLRTNLQDMKTKVSSFDEKLTQCDNEEARHQEAIKMLQKKIQEANELITKLSKEKKDVSKLFIQNKQEFNDKIEQLQDEVKPIKKTHYSFSNQLPEYQNDLRNTGEELNEKCDLIKKQLDRLEEKIDEQIKEENVLVEGKFPRLEEAQLELKETVQTAYKTICDIKQRQDSLADDIENIRAEKKQLEKLHSDNQLGIMRMLIDECSIKQIDFENSKKKMEQLLQKEEKTYQLWMGKVEVEQHKLSNENDHILKSVQTEQSNTKHVLADIISLQSETKEVKLKHEEIDLRRKDLASNLKDYCMKTEALLEKKDDEFQSLSDGLADFQAMNKEISNQLDIFGENVATAKILIAAVNRAEPYFKLQLHNGHSALREPGRVRVVDSNSKTLKIHDLECKCKEEEQKIFTIIEVALSKTSHIITDLCRNCNALSMIKPEGSTWTIPFEKQIIEIIPEIRSSVQGEGIALLIYDRTQAIHNFALHHITWNEQGEPLLVTKKQTLCASYNNGTELHFFTENGGLALEVSRKPLTPLLCTEYTDDTLRTIFGDQHCRKNSQISNNDENEITPVCVFQHTSYEGHYALTVLDLVSGQYQSHLKQQMSKEYVACTVVWKCNAIKYFDQEYFSPLTSGHEQHQGMRQKFTAPLKKMLSYMGGLDQRWAQN